MHTAQSNESSKFNEVSIWTKTLQLVRSMARYRRNSLPLLQNDFENKIKKQETYSKGKSTNGTNNIRRCIK
tara:strand:+ start:489 stop:701 length:213 start_codon:yes stop_codon:yes gene_type:complete